ncbi:hypothetical protein GCM10010123_42540 [Pilimelia anulata]|uniref:Prepilin-type N-terminal cleavage/methylation domain-containing protein n=1 Tax=Pilimelia anulata TaxID=53371 RepID=A0A8J3BBZ0_9ACTN|nr:prepilin-type N-terminal cleavage/methylation domain-containing protein [Pilimelia anulata]GGK08065.1 hypothetical protein GCM10010123_42540 [Pilimelia anulata]
MRRAVRPGDERGVTLIELSVAMGIMAVVGALVTAAVVGLSRSYRSTESLGSAQARVGQAFARLDASVRYAAELATRTTDGRPELWYLTPGDAPRCTVLWLAGDRLWSRTRPLGATAAAPETVLASGVAAPAGTAPFAVTAGADDESAAESAPAIKQVTVTLRVAASGGATRTLAATFPAPNTVAGASGASLDQCD